MILHTYIIPKKSLINANHLYITYPWIFRCICFDQKWSIRGSLTEKAHRGEKDSFFWQKRTNICSAFTITPLALTFKTWNVWENYISVKSSGILSKYNRPGTDFWMRTFDHLWPGLVDSSAVVIKTIRWELDKTSCISHPCHAFCFQTLYVLSLTKTLFRTTNMKITFKGIINGLSVTKIPFLGWYIIDGLS